MIQNNVELCYNFNTVHLTLIRIIWPWIGICLVYSYQKSVNSNISVKTYTQNKMISIGYRAHVGEDFVTSLKRNVKTDYNIIVFSENKVHTTAMAINALLEHVLIPLIFILCDNPARTCRHFYIKTIHCINGIMYKLWNESICDGFHAPIIDEILNQELSSKFAKFPSNSMNDTLAHVKLINHVSGLSVVTKRPTYCELTFLLSRHHFFFFFRDFPVSKDSLGHQKIDGIIWK